MANKCYSELAKLKTFEERFNYLKLDGRVGQETFGSSRHLNQVLYSSPEWHRVKRQVILRDNACDLGIEGREQNYRITVHHINPITPEMIENRDPAIFDMENLICCAALTHQALHYGDSNLMNLEIKERSPNDTCPWKTVS